MKSPVFPWGKFPGVDTVLGPEMKSTGEVMGVADNFGEAFAKAQIAAGQVLPSEGNGLLQRERPRQERWCRWPGSYVELGFHLVATQGTAEVLEQAGHAVGARLQGEGRPAERRRPDQGRAHSADRQHAARAGHVLR